MVAKNKDLTGDRVADWVLSHDAALVLCACVVAEQMAYYISTGTSPPRIAGAKRRDWVRWLVLKWYKMKGLGCREATVQTIASSPFLKN